MSIKQAESVAPKQQAKNEKSKTGPQSMGQQQQLSEEDEFMKPFVDLDNQAKLFEEMQEKNDEK